MASFGDPVAPQTELSLGCRTLGTQGWNSSDATALWLPVFSMLGERLVELHVLVAQASSQAQKLHRLKRAATCGNLAV